MRGVPRKEARPDRNSVESGAPGCGPAHPLDKPRSRMLLWVPRRKSGRNSKGAPRDDRVLEEVAGAGPVAARWPAREGENSPLQESENSPLWRVRFLSLPRLGYKKGSEDGDRATTPGSTSGRIPQTRSTPGSARPVSHQDRAEPHRRSPDAARLFGAGGLYLCVSSLCELAVKHHHRRTSAQPPSSACLRARRISGRSHRRRPIRCVRGVS